MSQPGRTRGRGLPLALAVNVIGVGALFLPWTARAAYGGAAAAAWGYELVAGALLVLALTRVPGARQGGPGVAELSAKALGRAFGPAVRAWYVVGITAGQAVVALTAAGFAAQAVGSVARPRAVEAGAVGVLTAAAAVAATGWRPRRWVTHATFAAVVAVVVVVVVAAVVAAPSAPAVSTPPGGGLRAVGHAAFLQLFAVVGWESAARLGGPSDRRALLVPLAGVALVGLVYGPAVLTAPSSVSGHPAAWVAPGLALPDIDGAVGRVVGGLAAALCALFAVRNLGTAAALVQDLAGGAAGSSDAARATRGRPRASGRVCAVAAVAAGSGATVGLVAAGWCRASDVLAVPDAMALAVFLAVAASAATLAAGRSRAWGVCAAGAYLPLLPCAGAALCFPVALLLVGTAAGSRWPGRSPAVTRR